MMCSLAANFHRASVGQAGGKHHKFWSFEGRGKLSATAGAASKAVKANLHQHFMSIGFMPDGSTLLGAADGGVYQFRGNALVSVLRAHESFVAGLAVRP